MFGIQVSELLTIGAVAGLKKFLKKHCEGDTLAVVDSKLRDPCAAVGTPAGARGMAASHHLLPLTPLPTSPVIDPT
jgi:hypothetical protein